MNKIDLPSDPKLAKQVLDSETKHRTMEIELGALGKFFGSNHKVPVYIAGLIASITVVVGFIYTFIPDDWKTAPTAEFWKIVSPIVMSCLAYIFGAATAKHNNDEA